MSMPKPKRTSQSSSQPFSRPQKPAGAPQKPRAKGSADAPHDFMPRNKPPHVKNRWRDEPAGSHPTQDARGDAPFRGLGRPPFAKRPKPAGAPPFEAGAKRRDDFPRPAAPKSRPNMPPPAAERIAPPKRAPRAKRVADDAEKIAAALAALPETPKKPPVVEPEVAAPQGPTFDELGLSDVVRAAVARAGYETPTPIQAGGIPILLQGHDLIGQAQTGTGKTAAFALPAIQLVDASDASTQVIVLAPTRELAIQVATETQTFATGTGVRVTAVYGGQPIDRQFRALKSGAHIVVGTPGRVLDHMRRETLTLASVKLCVLDEADEMLALGFFEEVEGILSELPVERQTALFSATMQSRVMALSGKFLRNPQTVQIENKRRTVETTKQTYYDVVPGKKQDALARVLDMETPGPTIIFCRTRNETEELAEALRVRGYSAESLNGDMGQTERERVLKRFRDGQADLLIATDVAARGLDIDTVTHVINYDIPWDVEQYIHRIGRTGRAGRTGDAITLVEPRQRRQLYFIEQQIGVKMTPARVPTSADIVARRRQRFVETLTETLDATDFDAYLDIVSDLSGTYDPSDVAAAALKLLWKTWSTTPEEIDTAVATQEDRTESGMVRVFIGAGRSEGLRPGDIVGILQRELGLTGRAIGAIDILDKTAFVEVPAAEAAAVVEVLSGTRFRGLKIRVHVANERR